MLSMGLDDDEAFARLRLIRSQNIGPITYRQLMQRFGNAQAAINSIPELASHGKGRAITLAKPADIENEIEQSISIDAGLIFWGTPQYPYLLAQMESAPACLIARGNLDLLNKPMVAMVGARNASAAACRFARNLSHDLGENNFIVVSGLARGIDTAAHIGAGGGHTIAVIAGGINIAYPPENADLQDRLGQDDLVLTEERYGTKPIARHFPNRNRIIAGLSLGTVVIEAAPKSGSLITARLAGELGREVMAIPGSPLDPRSRGCNSLIRDGATLIQNADDIIELLTPFTAEVRNHVRDNRSESQLGAYEQDISNEKYDEPDNDHRRDILSLLGMTFVAIDELVRQSGYSVSMVQMILLELELAGRLERAAGARVRLVE